MVKKIKIIIVNYYFKTLFILSINTNNNYCIKLINK